MQREVGTELELMPQRLLDFDLLLLEFVQRELIG
jgi:hypothetical protein